MRALVVEQAALIEQLRERIQELEAHLAQDSYNSTKPLSSDPLSGNHRRACSANRAGASQEAKRVAAAGTCACGRCGAEIGAEVLPERRRVVEVVIQRAATEYRIVGGTCTCGRVQRSAFPEGVTATVQYAPGVLALAVYLTRSQLLPYQRTAELSQELAGIALSQGTLQRAVTVPAIHLDRRARGRRSHWLHVLSTAELTAYFPHPKHTAEALDAFSLLEQFVGVLVHDHWPAYARYQCFHTFCNAHHLRELTAIAETIPSQQWATDMSALLGEANAQVNAARAQGLGHVARGLGGAPAGPPLRRYPHRRRNH